MGYLHSTEGKDGKVRLERWKAVGKQPPMPEIKAGRYLLEAFQHMRFAVPVDGGFNAQPWSEIAAFAAATGAVQEPWEVQALADMSMAYAEERNAASKDPLRIPPMERK